MTIKRDLSDLPTVEPKAEAPSGTDLAPTRMPELGPLIAHAWFEARTHDDHLAHAIADAGWYRGSYAGTCNLALWYKRTGVPESNPSTIADHWRMDLGTLVHQGLQDAITKAMPGAVHEVKVDLNSLGIPGSMHIDSVRPLSAWQVETVEIKSINGYGYKMSATKFRGKGPEGPRDSAAIQGALGAVAYQKAHPEITVTGSRIVYLSLENLSPDIASYVGAGGEEARFTSEWVIPYAQCEEIVKREKWRIDQIDKDLADGRARPRPLIPINVMHPAPGILQVVNPDKGTAVDEQGLGAKAFGCSYCPHRTVCSGEFGSPAVGA